MNFPRDEGQHRINIDKKEEKFNTSAINRTAQKIDLSIKDSSIISPKTTEKAASNYVNTNENRGGYRFGGYNVLSKNKILSPGSVLSKASLFESKSLANKTKDPAEMSLSERMALFERNKGEALIPKAPLTLSVPTRKLQESPKITIQSGGNLHVENHN